MNNIILIGYMAVGKSTVGKSLASLMNFKYRDTDRMIEKREGMEIKDIFKEKGEPYFRGLEKEIAKNLKNTTKRVVSTGGGLFMDKEVRDQLLKEDFVVFLILPMEDIYKRIQRNDRRPLAKAASPEELKERYEVRLPYYEKAHVCIDTKGKTPYQVAQEIRGRYHQWMEKGRK